MQDIISPLPDKTSAQSMAEATSAHRSLEQWGIEEISATASLNASVEEAQILLATSAQEALANAEAVVQEWIKAATELRNPVPEPNRPVSQEGDENRRDMLESPGRWCSMSIVLGLSIEQQDYRDAKRFLGI